MWSVDTSNQTNYIQAEDEIENDRKKRSSDLSSIKPKFSWRRARNLLWKHFIESYSNVTVLVWSIWWSLAMAGFLQIQSYVQILWQDIDEERESLFNGGVEAALTLFGAISCLIAGYIPNTIFEKFDLWILTLCSLIEGIMITISGVTNEIWIAYIMYVLFGVVYMFMITLVTATVAKNIADDSFALIFGINTFIALVIQTILTVVFVTNFGFALSPRMQFIVLGGYFLVLTGIFLVASIVKLICHCHKE
jgi:solute carrier family 19 (thiamine transporter), member 2/3